MENSEEIETIYWIGTSLMLLISLGILFLVLSYRNHLYKIKQKEADLLLKASLEGERIERNRIAADLHDSVSGDLNAIKNYLLFIEKTSPLKEHQEILDEIKNSVILALENTRQVSYKLMPPLLENLGLIPTVEDYLLQLSKKTQLSFTSHAAQEGLQFEPGVAYEIFRIVQEFTTNMVKYGKLTHCEVVFDRDGNQNTIVITDDGTPYDFFRLMPVSTGTGLKNINSRIKSIGAELEQKQTAVGNHFVIYLKK